MYRRFMFLKTNVLRHCLSLPRGYIHVYDDNIHIFSQTARPVKSKIYVELRYEMRMQVY